MMFIVRKRVEIAGGHRLDLPYDSKCKNLHGHNWIVNIEVQSETLTSYGMVVDFTHIKRVIDRLDHQNLNDIVDINPTAENIAQWIWYELTAALPKENSPVVTEVSIQESEGNVACYRPSIL